MPELALPIAMVGSSVIGGLFNSSANDKAAQAAKYAADLQQQRYEQMRGDLAPYRAGGSNALDLYNNAIGVNGDAAQKNYFANFQKDPGFQSQVDYGIGNINAQMAAQNKGGMTGNQLAALQDFSMKNLSQEYHTRLSDLFQEGQLGENAAAMTGAVGQKSAQAQGDFGVTAGQYQGAATAAIGQAAGTGVNNLANYYYKNPSAFGSSGPSSPNGSFDPTGSSGVGSASPGGF